MQSSSSISPQALVEGDVGTGTTIGPFVVVEVGARVGRDCVLHAGAVVAAGVAIGDGVELLHHAVVGREPGGAGATLLEPRFRRELTIGDGCSIGAHATIYYDVVIGSHTLIGDGASIREGARIGSRCIVSRCVSLNYGVQIGDGVKIMDNTHITGRTVIGDGAFVSTGVATTNDNDPVGPRDHPQRGPRIESGAMIGAGAILLPGVAIGAGATVGAGAVVTRDVAAGSTVLGLPARARP